MAIREYRQPVGTDLRDGSMQSGHIEGVYIDNPSGSWLRVTGIERYVPPYTEGWSATIKPGQTSVDVLFVASPSGTPSLNVGGPTLVRLSDVPFPDSPGYASGSATYQEPKTVDIQQVNISFDIVETANSNVVVAGVAGQRIIPRKFFAAITGGGTTQFHSAAFLQLWDSVPAALILPTIALSPDHPHETIDYESGKALATGLGVVVIHQTAEGGGRVAVEVFFQFYRLVNQ